MEGDSETPVLISNAAVMELLQDSLASRETQHSSSSRSKRSKLYRHRDWIEKHVHEYLQSTPCGQLEKSRQQEFQAVLRSNKKQATMSNNGNTATSATTTASATTTGFDLTEAESLQILNFMPTEPVEIHLMIEELHARMTEKQQEGLLEFIASYTIKEDAMGTNTNTNGAAAANGKGTKTPSVAVKKEEEHAEI
jgi:hypothetical protein